MGFIKKTSVVVIVCLAVTLLSCATTKQPPGIGHDKVIRASVWPPPEWINNIPDASDGYVNFVGVSTGAAEEATARDRARLDVVSQVTLFLGVFAERDFEERAVSMNLDSGSLDPTVAARDYVSYTNKNFVSRIRTAKTYWELRSTPGGNEYFVYAFVPFPVNESMSSFAASQIAAAQKSIREAQDEKAKKQAQDVVDFWQQTQSVFEDE